MKVIHQTTYFKLKLLKEIWDSHSGINEDSSLPEHDTALNGKQWSIKHSAIRYKNVCITSISIQSELY